MPYLQELYQRSRGAMVWLIDTTELDHLGLAIALHGHQVAHNTGSWMREHGLRDPAVFATAFGKVVMANNPSIAELVLRQGVPRLTRNTLNGPRYLEVAMARTREEGAAAEHEQVRLGWSCLAVPIPTQGSCSAVLGIVDRVDLFESSKLTRMAKATADGIAGAWQAV